MAILVGALILLGLIVIPLIVVDFFDGNSRAARAVGDAAWGLWTIVSWAISIATFVGLAYLIGSIFVE